MHYLRNPAVHITELDNGKFLVEPESDKIYYLDEISSGIWHFLADICDLNDLIEALGSAFPETPDTQIKDDLTKIIKDMSKAGVILPESNRS